MVKWCKGAGDFQCPTYLDNGRAKAYCGAGGADGGCLDIFTLVYHFFSSFSLSLEGHSI